MNAEQEFFKDNGYCLAKGVYSSDEICGLEKEFDRIVKQLQACDSTGKWAKKGVIDTRNVQQYSAVWMAAMLHKNFLDTVEQFIGPDIVLNHTTLYHKLPTTAPSPFNSHQDWGYLRTENDTLIGAMIHVSEATEQMGCLRVYPGSNQHGRMDAANHKNAAFYEKYPLQDATAIKADAGDVTFFDSFVVHGSMSNHSDKPRKTVIARLFSGKDRKEDIYAPNENLVLRGWNHRMTRDTALKVPAKRAKEKTKEPVAAKGGQSDSD